MEKQSNISASFTSFLKQLFLVEKLNNIYGFLLLSLMSCLFAYVIVAKGIVAALLLIVFMIALPVLYAIVAYPRVGIIVLLVFAYIIMWILRFPIHFPLGTVMDALQVLLIIGFLVNQKSENNWKIYKNPISYLIIIWIVYNLIQIANPTAESRLAWVYTIRSVAFVMLMYFVFMYYLRSLMYIRIILSIWIILTIIAAVYGLKQEFVGFFNYEQESISDPLTTLLYFIDGRWRKFSIFSDPVAFAYNMVVSALLCFALAWGVKSIKKKIVLGVLACLFIYSMLFSGTRGAYVLVPAALLLFCILTFSKKILLFATIAAVFIGLVIVMPTSNPTIMRFQSAFKPSEDASFNVRKANQKRIQPYILSHPLGGGLGATGVWGQRFAPNSYLAKFPPDSGYVRVAVELGWIGLLIFCLLMFFILKTGVENFFKIKNRELKTYCLAMVLIAFAYNIGNYPQEALVQFPSNIYFYLVVALIVRTYQIDQELQEKNKSCC